MLAMEEIGRGGVAEKVGGEKKRWERKRKWEMDKKEKKDLGTWMDLP